MIATKPYTEATADDFAQLFHERFPAADARVLKVIRSNPACAAAGDAGSIAYNAAGEVMAIFGLLPRIVYNGAERIRAMCGIALAVKKTADRSFLTPYIRDTIVSSKADIFFGNTAIAGSRKRFIDAVAAKDGPLSCVVLRERLLWPSRNLVARILTRMLRLLIRKFRRTVPGCIERVCTEGSVELFREPTIDVVAFANFWSRYLAGNRGLVTSRTPEELDWAFGSGLESGEIILITAREREVVLGYVFCRRTDATASCWRIVDLIAINNDEKILSALIASVSKYLRHRVAAFCLQITGFPMWVQPLIERYFPGRSSFGYNKCIWTYLNEETQAKCGDWINAKDGWYGGPYDGDMCLT